MMLTLIKMFAYLYYIAWFVWPIAFVFGLAYGIKKLFQTNKLCNIGLVIASIALLLIVAGVMYPSLAG